MTIETSSNSENMNPNDFLKKYWSILEHAGLGKWVDIWKTNLKENKDVFNAIPKWKETTLLEKLLDNVWGLEIIRDLLLVWKNYSYNGVKIFELISRALNKWKPKQWEESTFLQISELIKEKIWEEIKEVENNTSFENSQKTLDSLIKDIRNSIGEDGSIKEKFNVIAREILQWINNTDNLKTKWKMLQGINNFINTLDKDKHKNIIKKLEELVKRLKVNNFEKILNQSEINDTNIGDQYKKLEEKILENDIIGIIEIKKEIKNILQESEIDKHVKRELFLSLESIYIPHPKVKTIYALFEIIVNSDFIRIDLRKFYNELVRKNNINIFEENVFDNTIESLKTRKKDALYSPNGNSSPLTRQIKSLEKLKNKFELEKALFLNPNLDEETLRKIIKNIEVSKNPLIKALFENIFLNRENNLKELLEKLNKNPIEEVKKVVREIISLVNLFRG